MLQIYNIRKNMATHKKRFVVTDAQMKTLWEFLDSHRDIAMGYNESVETRNHYRRMWERVTQSLNALDGEIRDWKDWSNYWIDYKARLKKKVLKIKTADDQTQGSSQEIVSLTELEKKFYDILGNNNGLGTSKMPIDPFSEELTPSNNNVSSACDIVEPIIDSSTQTPDEPLGCTSVSTQSIDSEATSSRSTETEQPVVAATQTAPVAELATSSAVVVRRRRRVATPYSAELRRAYTVTTFGTHGLSSTRSTGTDFTGMVTVLSRMIRVLERIEARLNGPRLTG